MAKKTPKKTESEVDSKKNQPKESKSPSLADQSSENIKDDSDSKSSQPDIETTNKDEEDTAETNPKKDNIKNESKTKEEDKDQVEEKDNTKESKDESEEVENKADTNKDGLISSREMVNAIDSNNSVSDEDPSQDEVLTRKIEKQLEQKEEYFIMRIKKSSFLLMAGFLVLSLWSIPLGRFLSTRYNLSFESLKQVFSKSEELTATEVVEPIAEEEIASPSAISSRIRIKSSEETDSAKNLLSLLKESGYVNSEIYITDDIDSEGVTIAAKKDELDLLSTLLTLLESDYFAASSSSQVTEDSDFSAVILMGNK